MNNILLFTAENSGSASVSWGILEAGLLISIIVVSILIGIVSIVAFFARASIFYTYNKYNRKVNSSGLTGGEAARKLLDEAGLTEVEVVKANWWQAMIYGNSYSGRKKKIRLRRGIINKKSITSVGLACQKVGLALQDRDGDKKFRIKDRLQFITLFAPLAFLPMVIIGVIIDIFLTNFSGVITTIFLIFGTVYFILAFILTMVTWPVEKKACNKAMEIMEQTNFLNEEERQCIDAVFRSYKLAYLTDFILSILELIKIILQILLKIVQAKSSK